MGRRKYSKEFKRDAVSLIETSGKSMSQVARELGVGPSVVGAWGQMVNDERKSGLSSDEQEELKRLRQDNDRLKMEVEIPKKLSRLGGILFTRSLGYRRGS